MNAQPRLCLCALIALSAGCSGNVEDADGGADAQVIIDAGDVVDAGTADLDATVDDAQVLIDAGDDSGVTSMDSGSVDASAPDASTPDTGPADAGPADTGAPDTGPADTGPADTGPADTGAPDTGPADTGPADTGAPDTGPADTGTPDAGMLDAGGPAGCDVLVAPPEAPAGQVGGSGGSPGPNLGCPLGVEIIGVAVRISDQNTANGSPSAVGFTAVCADVQVSSAGATVGAETLPEVAGSGLFGWSPATQSTITRCPPGWIVSGLTASRGASNNLFIDVTVQCSQLLPSGATSGSVQNLVVMGSGLGAGTYDTVACASGQVASRMTTRVGAGLDAVGLVCGTPGCAGP